MIRTLLLTAAIGFSAAAVAEAQSSRTFSGGSSMGGTLSGGQRTLTGNGGNATGTSTDAQTDAGSLSGSERFLRENRQGAFVGADANDSTQMRTQQAETTGSTGRTGLGGRGGRDPGLEILSAFAEREFRNNQNGGSVGSSTQPVMRRTIAVDFDFPAATPDRTETALNARLVEVASLRRFAGALTVRMAGRTAVVEGVVADERDKRLAENLLRLEPGVSRIENRIVVSSALPAPTE